MQIMNVALTTDRMLCEATGMPSVIQRVRSWYTSRMAAVSCGQGQVECYFHSCMLLPSNKHSRLS